MDIYGLGIGMFFVIIIAIIIEWAIGVAIGKSITKSTGVILGIILMLLFPLFLMGIAIIIYSGKNEHSINCNSNYSTIPLVSSNVSPVNSNAKYISKDWKTIFYENNLTEYIEIFQNNKLDNLELISQLTETDLEKIGITAMGDRKRILNLFSLTNVQVLNDFKGEFIPTHVVRLLTNTDGLSLRKSPDPSMDPFIKLPNGFEVQHLNTGNKIEFLGKYAPWFEIKTKEGICGWCFSGSLEDIIS